MTHRIFRFEEVFGGNVLFFRISFFSLSEFRFHFIVILVFKARTAIWIFPFFDFLFFLLQFFEEMVVLINPRYVFEGKRFCFIQLPVSYFLKFRGDPML